MNRAKVLEFFDAATMVERAVHVVGCGAIGSNVAEQLTRLGVNDIHLWDFDLVEPKNVTNQMFFDEDINKEKVDATEELCKRINPQINIVKHPKGIDKPFILNGYIFLCVDNIELRKAIVEANKNNPNCIAFFDFRMRLTDAQHYFADREKPEQVEALLSTMDFTHDEATEATPTSACGVELSVCYTVKSIVCYGIANFVNFCLGNEPKLMILSNMETMQVTCFPM